MFLTTFIKRHTRWFLPLILVAFMLAGAGCEVDELKAKNHSLTERCEKLDAEREQLLLEKEQLNSTLAQQKTLAAEKDQKISGLQEERQKLRDGLVKLKKMYDELAKRPNRPLPPGLNTALRQFAAANPKIAEFDERNGMVKLKSDLTFPPGGAAPTAEAATTIAKLVEILNSPEAGGFSVYVAGHTDDIRIGRPETRRKHPTNWYLSAHRAVGVQKVLAEAKLDPKRISVMGFGEYHPIAPNKPGKKGNKLNRRVEIWIVPAGAFLTAEAAK